MEITRPHEDTDVIRDAERRLGITQYESEPSVPALRRAKEALRGEDISWAPGTAWAMQLDFQPLAFAVADDGYTAAVIRHDEAGAMRVVTLPVRSADPFFFEGVSGLHFPAGSTDPAYLGRQGEEWFIVANNECFEIPVNDRPRINVERLTLDVIMASKWPYARITSKDAETRYYRLANGEALRTDRTDFLEASVEGLKVNAAYLASLGGWDAIQHVVKGHDRLVGIMGWMSEDIPVTRLHNLTAGMHMTIFMNLAVNDAGDICDIGNGFLIHGADHNDSSVLVSWVKAEQDRCDSKDLGWPNGHEVTLGVASRSAVYAYCETGDLLVHTAQGGIWYKVSRNIRAMTATQDSFVGCICPPGAKPIISVFRFTPED